MKGVAKFIIYIVLILVLAIGGFLIYNEYEASKETNWDDKDEIEIEQQQAADSVANSSGIFD